MRLVLRGDAAHFNRLVICSKCGREVPGRAMLSPADLDHPPQAVVCNDCVEVATEPAWTPAPVAPEVEPEPEPEGAPEPEALDPDVHAEMNRELEVLVEELAEPEEDEPVEAEVEVDPEAEAATPALVLLDDDAGIEPPETEGEGEGEAGAEPDPLEPVGEEAALDYELEPRLPRAEARPGPGAGEAGEAAAGGQDDDDLRRQLVALADRLELTAATVADMDTRLGQLAAQVATAAGEDADRSAALDRRMEQALARLSASVESRHAELRVGLRDELAQMLASAPTPAQELEKRLRVVEQDVRASRAEASELNELHAALDAGLGVLRAEIGDVRTALGRQADTRAELEDRLETFVRMSLVPEAEKGRKGKKAAGSTIGTLSAAVEDLLREQRQLKDKMVALEKTSDVTTAAAARAVTQAASLGPIRSDMKLLHQEVVEQNEALDALRRSIDALRRQAPPPPTAAPRRAAAAKAAPTVKATRTVKVTAAKVTAAKAPAARAKKA